jgi:Ca2+-binding RTX toxin-like protein
LRKTLRLVGALELAAAILTPTTSADASVPLCFKAKATIVGTSGVDNLIGTPGADVIVGLGGGGHIYGVDGSDRICAGGGDDFV